MNNLSSSQRSHLRRNAHQLEPIVLIGKNGVTDGTLDTINRALNTGELIKIKFREFKDNKQGIADEIVTQTLSLIVGTIGHTLIVFKQNPNPEEQEYQLP